MGDEIVWSRQPGERGRAHQLRYWAFIGCGLVCGGSFNRDGVSGSLVQYPA